MTTMMTCLESLLEIICSAVIWASTVMNRRGWSVGQTMCHEPPWLVYGADLVPWTTMVGQWGRPCAMNRHGWSMGQTMCHEPPWLVSGADHVPWTAMVGQWSRPCAMNHHDWSVGQTLCHEPPRLVSEADHVWCCCWCPLLCTVNSGTNHTRRRNVLFSASSSVFVFFFLSLHQCPSASRSTHTNPTPHTILF